MTIDYNFKLYTNNIIPFSFNLNVNYIFVGFTSYPVDEMKSKFFNCTKQHIQIDFVKPKLINVLRK